MNNEELKKKICDIIAPYVSAYGDDERIADALIAAGIGDVKEVEAEANRYEMLYKMQSRDMVLAERKVHEAERKVHEAEHRAARAEKALSNELVQKAIRLGVTDIRPWYRQALEEAEKELAEENDGKKEI